MPSPTSTDITEAERVRRRERNRGYWLKWYRKDPERARRKKRETRERRKANPEKHELDKARSRQRYSANLEQSRKRSRESHARRRAIPEVRERYLKRHNAWARKWHRDNPELSRAQNKKRRERRRADPAKREHDNKRHLDNHHLRYHTDSTYRAKMLARGKRYRTQNPDKVRETKRRWRSANVEKERARRKRRNDQRLDRWVINIAVAVAKQQHRAEEVAVQVAHRTARKAERDNNLERTLIQRQRLESNPQWKALSEAMKRVYILKRAGNFAQLEEDRKEVARQRRRRHRNKNQARIDKHKREKKRLRRLLGLSPSDPPAPLGENWSPIIGKLAAATKALNTLLLAASTLPERPIIKRAA